MGPERQKYRAKMSGPKRHGFLQPDQRPPPNQRLADPISIKAIPVCSKPNVSTFEFTNHPA